MKIDGKTSFRLLLLAAALGGGKASFAEDAPGPQAPAVAVSTPAAAAPAPQASDDPVYVYTPVTRDPFLPLSGGASSDISAASSVDKDAVGAFKPASVELKGIIRTRTGRWAVLSGTGGERYVVENGKLKDAKKKPVEGYVGIIKEKSLVLIGPNNQVTELRLKRDLSPEEQAKPKK